MDDAKKKADRSSQPGPDENGSTASADATRKPLTGVVTYVGLPARAPQTTPRINSTCRSTWAPVSISRSRTSSTGRISGRHHRSAARRMPRLRPRRRDDQVGHDRDPLVRSQRQRRRRLRPDIRLGGVRSPPAPATRRFPRPAAAPSARRSRRSPPAAARPALTLSAIARSSARSTPARHLRTQVGHIAARTVTSPTRSRA
jgi:hypothetical protein